MEILQIERTKHTPKVVFDPEDLQILIDGVSRPENAKKFYQPLIKWLNDFSKQLPVTTAPLNVELKLNYFNSSTVIYLSEIFRIVNSIHQSGMKVLIDWYIDEGDELIKDAGEELSEVSGLPFNFVKEI